MTSIESPQPVKDLWFADGNLILQAELSLFRVYRGILAARSTIFHDMFLLPMSDGGDNVEGCPFIFMHDSAEDMTNFLKAIFDSGYFEPPPTQTTFEVVAGILRLSTKYDVDYLRKRAIRHLSGTYPVSLDTWEHRGSHRTIPPLDNTPFMVLSLAREFDLSEILPSVVYCVCSHMIEKTLDGITWYGTHIDMSSEDKELCLAARSKLVSMQTKSIEEITKLGSCARQTCESARTEYKELLLSRDAAHFLDFVPEHYYMKQDFCEPCFAAFKQQCRAARQSMWDSLPGLVDMKGWKFN